jgi:hypothetical protein
MGQRKIENKVGRLPLFARGMPQGEGTSIQDINTVMIIG